MSINIPDADPVRVGDAVKLPFKLVDEATGNPIDLSSGTLSWDLREDIDYPIALSRSDSGVSIVDRDDANGEFSIKLETGATNELEATTYRERVTFTDNVGNETTWVGKLPFESDE